MEYATHISNRPGVNSQGTYFLLSFHTFNSWIIIRYYTACNMSVLAVRAYRLQIRLSWKNFLDCGNTFLSFGSWHLLTSSLVFTLSSRIVLSLKANLRWTIAALWLPRNNNLITERSLLKFEDVFFCELISLAASSTFFYSEISWWKLSIYHLNRVF